MISRPCGNPDEILSLNFSKSSRKLSQNDLIIKLFAGAIKSWHYAY